MQGRLAKGKFYSEIQLLEAGLLQAELGIKVWTVTA